MVTKRQLNILLKKNKIRECHVKLSRLKISGNDAYQKALFRMHNIRDLIVLNRVVIDKPSTSGPKRKLLTNKDKGSVRSNVIWLANNPMPVKKSVKFAQHTQRHTVSLTSNQASPEIVNFSSAINPAKRRRANSMFAERPVTQVPQSMPTMEDLHAELLVKRANLKPASERQLGPLLDIQPTPQWKRIQEELKLKLVAKK